MIAYSAHIPDVVLGAIIAAVSAFGGVWLTNRNSRVQHQDALKHDAKQRDRDRNMALRRDVYLKAAEAFSKELNSLIRIADLTVTDKQISSDFVNNSGAISKVEIVGTNKTVQALHNFSTAFAAAYMELSLKRIPLIARKQEIAFIANEMQKSSQEAQLNIQLMKQYNLDGNSDQKFWEAIKNNFKFEQDRQKKLIEEKGELDSMQIKEHLDLIAMCHKHMLSVSQFIPPAVFAVRDELELPIDKDSYLITFNGALEKNKENLNSFLSEIETMETH